MLAFREHTVFALKIEHRSCAADSTLFFLTSDGQCMRAEIVRIIRIFTKLARDSPTATEMRFQLDSTWISPRARVCARQLF